MSARAAHDVIWFFDCDGVLLESNSAKTEAFRQATLPYGADVAENVVRHHVANGGISRFAKFQRLFDDVLRRPANLGEIEELLERFAAASRAGLARAPVDNAIEPLVKHLRAAATAIHVVSGGLEEEVAWALERHGIHHLFDGIHGSPTTKHDHIARVLAAHPTHRGIYVGDSRSDMQVAAAFGLDAVFVSHWTEFVAWPSFVDTHPEVAVVDDLSGLLERLTVRTNSAPDWLRSLS